MKKIDRRTFLRRAGATAAAVAAGCTLMPSLSANNALSATSTDKDENPYDRSAAGDVLPAGNHMISHPEDNGLALVNPHMGWTMHFYSNILDNYASTPPTRWMTFRV